MCSTIYFPSFDSQGSWPHARARARFRCKARYFHRRMYRASQIRRHRVHERFRGRYVRVHARACAHVYVCVCMYVIYVYFATKMARRKVAVAGYRRSFFSLSLSLSLFRDQSERLPEPTMRLEHSIENERWKILPDENVSVRSNGIALSPRCLKNDRIQEACCATSEGKRGSIFCVVRIPNKKENLWMISSSRSSAR